MIEFNNTEDDANHAHSVWRDPTRDFGGDPLIDHLRSDHRTPSEHHAPTGMLAAVKYLVEELHVDPTVRDHEGNNAIHDAAARGDVEMIKYLVSKGVDVKAVNREGKTTADMAKWTAVMCDTQASSAAWISMKIQEWFSSVFPLYSETPRRSSTPMWRMRPGNSYL